MTIRTRDLGIILVIMTMTAAILWSMGRSPICPCGTVRFWTSAVNSAENSQQLADWYTFSHIIHGFLFFALLRWLRPASPFGVRLTGAVLIEAAWEIAENSPFIINRYREATIALGYNGDSIINSMADISWMALGVLFAARVRTGTWVAVAIIFELFTLWMIRDNLTLNVLMLVYPIDAIKMWQGGG